MRFALVAPATIPEFGAAGVRTGEVRDLAEHVPLGVLTLAAVLRAHGADVTLLDPNALFVEHARRATRGGFVEEVAGALCATGADVVGFGTLSSSYPLTLRVATAFKRRRPGVTVVLGGPQASVVDEASLRGFGAVDFVLRGEADETLVTLTSALERGTSLAVVPGLSWRAQGPICRNPPAPAPLDLDRVPLPAYDLFPPLAGSGVIPFEVGRGCPYGCSFCSTNTFFRRRFRLKSPAVIVRQMRELAARYHIDDFDFVHDMLTVDRDAVLELCDALAAEGRCFRWHCSARTDRVDDELLERMVAAGCRGIFFGIETGAPALQRSHRKRLDLGAAERRVASAAQRGLTIVVSLICGFPDENEAELRATVDWFVRALRWPTVSPQLHLLAPLAGSALHAEFQDRLVFDDVFSDMSHSGSWQSPEDRALIRDHPRVFPNFYAVPTALDRRRLKELRQFLLTAATHCRQVLLAAHLHVHALDLFTAFRSARGGEDPIEADDGGVTFRASFVRFLRARVMPTLPRPEALEAVLSLADATEEARTHVPASPRRRGVPVRAAGTAMATLDVDCRALLGALASGSDLGAVPFGAQRVAVRLTAGGVDLLELHPLAARVWSMCDGRHSRRDLEAAVIDDAHEAASARTACRVALASLRDARLLA